MKTWLITGCSSGLGKAIATAVAERGDKLIATSRDSTTLSDLARHFPDTVRAIDLDVTNPRSALKAMEFAEREFGGLDVLVNNAGFGLIGAVEEVVPDEYRPLFETNVFGMFETIRAALPLMRRKVGGRIVNLSSTAGIKGIAGSGYYAASKFVVEGMSEALAEELAPLGMKVVIVEPGPFRTNFLGRSISMAAREIADYAETAGRRRRYRADNDGQQGNDPEKAAAIILMAVDSARPPLHLPLGSAAFDTAEQKIASLQKDIQGWKEIALWTEFEVKEVSIAPPKT